MRNPTPSTRRGWQATLIISLFFLAVAAAAGTGWWYARESPPHQGPIVLISVEALRARQLPAYGGAQTATPAIDALAADGVLFTRAYSHSPYTLPAHASLLTGQLPFEHGVRYDAGYALEDQARTMAEQLQNRGFATGGAVSSFLLRRQTGLAQGFSYFNADLPAAEPGNEPGVERDGLATFSAAEQWLRLQSGQRYFLFIEVNSSNADAVVSKLVQHLKDRGLYDGATIVLTAAHGDTAGARLDDRSLAIPLIVKQPEGEGAGRNVSVPVQLIDVAPTLLDLVRAPVPGNLRGRSLRPILDDEDGEIGSTPIFAESLDAAFRTGGPPVYAVTFEGYRLTRGATEVVAKVDEAAAQDSLDETARAARLRAALDRLLERTEIKAAEAIPPDLEGAYAAAGYIPTLRLLREPAGPADPEVQATMVDAHRAAVRLVAAQQYGQAAASLKRLSDAHGGLPPVQFQVGALLARTGRFGDAIAAFLAAMTARPDDPEVPTAIANTHLRARALEDASAAATDAIARAEKTAIPQFLADAHEVALRIALARRDSEAALMHAQAAEAADPSRPFTAFARGRLAYENGMYEEALTLLTDATRAARDRVPQIRELHQALGDTLAQMDRFADAETEFKEELRLFPDSVNAYASLAMLYRASNREDAVEQTIADLLAAAPTSEGYATAARLWTIVGERARADAIRADARRRFGN